MPVFEYDKDYPFAAFITNLGKYNEGELVGEWVKFPTTHEELQKVFERIGIGSEDDFGHPYEEWFITDYDCYVGNLYDKLGEYENLDELNYLASKLEDMDRDEYNQFMAAMEVSDHTGSIQELINLTENLDCYDVYPDIEDHDDLGRYYIDELEAMEVPDHLRNYIDYEAYGRDIALSEGGEFTEFGYVRDTGDYFVEVYDGNRENIPEEYRVMTSAEEELSEEEISEWAMDIAYDMDEFFRQHDPQYAAEHPEEHAAKEEIYENLSDCRIAALEEKLTALGQTKDDYLPSELEKYKGATGYEEFLDFDGEAVREGLQNPDKSHVNEMLSFAEQAEREYSAEAAEIAAACDEAFRNYTYDYGNAFPKEDVQRQVLADAILSGETYKIKTGLVNMGREGSVTEEVAPLVARLDAFEKENSVNTYMVYQLKDGADLRNFRFEPLDRLHSAGLSVDPANYELVYAASLTPGETLETIYTDLNIHRPDDFHGHSLSVSDIVVMREYGKDTAHYCDSFGFSQVPEFFKPEPLVPDDLVSGERVSTPRGSFALTDMSRQQIEAAGYGLHHQSDDGKFLIMGNGTKAFAIRNEDDNPLRTAEMTIEDDYGMIDGVINNGRRGEEQEKAQAVPEKKVSIMERLADAKKECAERKPPEKAAPHKKPPELGDL